MRTTGEVDFYVDGVLAVTVGTSEIAPPQFGEFHLFCNGDVGNTITVTDFQAGTGYVVVPEPLTCAGVLLGLGGLGQYSRKRSRA